MYRWYIHSSIRKQANCLMGHRHAPVSHSQRILNLNAVTGDTCDIHIMRTSGKHLQTERFSLDGRLQAQSRNDAVLAVRHVSTIDCPETQWHFDEAPAGQFICISMLINMTDCIATSARTLACLM